MPSPSQCVNVTSGLSIEFPPRAFHFVTGGAMRPAVSVTHFQLFEKIPQSTHVKISQVVPGLLPEQCLNYTLLSCVSNIVGPTILFMAVGNRESLY